jgi:glyoxylase-like metal-dependent hydrolase (beta-lactamase superfamily II)
VEKHIAVDRVISEGDTVTIDGLSFEVLETPGHSKCSLSFYDPAGRVLLISDATGYYMPEHDCWWPNYFADYDTYMGSMQRLAGLDAEILCLSHNAVIQGAEEIKSYFSGAISATKEYHQRIIDEAKAGKSPRQIGEKLGSEIVDKTQLLPLDFFQKNCGLLAKLSFRHEGISVEKNK